TSQPRRADERDRSAEQPAPSGRAGEDEEEATYADLYARAAAREPDATREPDEEAPEAAEEPTWTLHSIVTGENDDEDAVASPTEKERIRRILEDLD
ncbi:MAG: hypothetical protein R3362_10405, partial [Rhodothermales bacterium]|nr:hypothetical protein [Rhodothermales bacterium]